MSKLIQHFFLISFFAALATVPAHADEINMQPGMWKWTTKMEMPGMPFALPPISYSDCISKKDLIPEQPEEGDQQCKILDQKITRDYVQWKMECNVEGGKTTSDGKISYNGTTASGEIHVLAQGMKMTTKLEGQRTGACK